jgi:hypothetical protein
MVSREEAVARRLPLRSIDFDSHWVDLCGQGPDRCREGVDQFSTTAPQLFLEPWRTGDFDHGNDLNWRLRVHSVGSTRKECCHTLCHKWGVCDMQLSTNDYVDAAVDDLSVQGIECEGVLALARRFAASASTRSKHYMPIDKCGTASTSVE